MLTGAYTEIYPFLEILVFTFPRGWITEAYTGISKFYCLQGFRAQLVLDRNKVKAPPPPLSTNSFIRPWLIMSLIFLPYGSLSCHRSPPRTRHKTVFHRTTSRTCTPLDSTNQPQNHTCPDRPP